MSDIEPISQAFNFLYQYEEYQLKKAWGIMMIVIGLLVFIGGFLSRYTRPSADPLTQTSGPTTVIRFGNGY